MKKCICFLSFCWFIGYASAQSISLSTNKTTSLVFPYPVRHVDAGSPSVLIQPIRGAQNILLVKAALKDFDDTNLSVFTEDGGIYTFNVRYDAYPRSWVYRLPILTNATIGMYATSILDNPSILHGMRKNKWRMGVELTGIYVNGPVLYCQLRLNNNSPIDYEIDILRFYISDKKQARRSAIQEIDLNPLYCVGKRDVVKSYQTNTIVVALDKFTIPDAKVFRIQLMERNGGRHLNLKVRNKDILKARVLPDAL